MFIAFECIKYDIISNTYNIFHNFPNKILSSEVLCNFQYFEETEEIVLLFIGYYENNDFGMIIYVCDLEGNCTEKSYQSIGIIPDLKDIYSRTLLVIPKDKLTYHIFAFSENIDYYALDSGIEFVLKNKNNILPTTIISDNNIQCTVDEYLLDKCNYLSSVDIQ